MPLDGDSLHFEIDSGSSPEAAVIDGANEDGSAEKGISNRKLVAFAVGTGLVLLGRLNAWWLDLSRTSLVDQCANISTWVTYLAQR